MIEDGLVAEVRSLLPFRNLNALQTVGYSELFDYFDNKIGLDETVDKIRQHTRNYARRQMTWFRREPGITWLTVEESEPLEQTVDRVIHRIDRFLAMLDGASENRDTGTDQRR